MCGIAGFVGPEGNESDLRAMLARMKLRGPDDEGVLVRGSVHLGHKRLSIIDLSENARQPMTNEDATVWLIYNGEIYNFRSLRDDLVQRGHVFKSHTDSEVIIHLYEEKGVDAFALLNGMFAFCLWDTRRNKLFLARDRMGQKPLYYAQVKDTFMFASECGALLKHPLFKKTLNLKAVAKFLFYEHVPTPDCIWEGAGQLYASSYLAYDIPSRTFTVTRYAGLTYLPRLDAISNRTILDTLDGKIADSVKRHLISDVPAGVYLSGGIDSSTVAYYAQKAAGRIKTFTIAFEEDSFGEQERARATAEMLGTEHHEIPFTHDDFLKTTMEIIPRLDAPFADSSLIPAYHLNKYSRPRITVALGGEGGDELFVGYPIYMAHQVLEYLRRIPPWIRRSFIVPAVSLLPSSYRNETWEYRMKKFFEAERYFHNPFYCQQIWLGAFGPALLKRLFRADYHGQLHLEALFDNIDYYRAQAQAGEDVIDGLMRQTQAKYLMDDGLTKTDRASMMNSLECRAPFLDREIVEWVNRIPFTRKYKSGKLKVLLKELMQGRIPAQVLSGPKRGFTPPIAEWFVTRFGDQVRDVIFAESPFFNRDFIERVWNEHARKKYNHRKLLWTLFIWQLWSRENV